ncbi:MAG: PucR family transcriptional regulator [Pseudoclavibacter sp.]
MSDHTAAGGGSRASDRSQTLTRLRSVSGEMATATLQRLDETLPWYAALPPARRSAIGLVAQSGIQSFINWFANRGLPSDSGTAESEPTPAAEASHPHADAWVAADIFGNAPRELIRSVSLQQTLQLVQVVISVVQEQFTSDDPELRLAFLTYSRDVAFAAADVYAKAAEARGQWDDRLEALVVDSVLNGESADELPSRVAALGWQAVGEVNAVIASVHGVPDLDQLRRQARQLGAELLVGVQADRLVLVLAESEHEEGVERSAAFSVQRVVSGLMSHFSDGPIVIGPPVPTVLEASTSAQAAQAGFTAVAGWQSAPRPTLADDVLPERALAGDPLARVTLIQRAYLPLVQQTTDLLGTLRAYLESGRSLEGTARALYVHPNTVRYRLRRIAEVVGWDPTEPRDALILQTALILGAINDTHE